MNRTGRVIATALVAATLGVVVAGCGSTEPESRPAATAAADDGIVTEDEARAVLSEVSEEKAMTTGPADCETALPSDDPDSWETRYNTSTDVDAALAILDAVPDPASACTDTDRESFQRAHDLAASTRARVAASAAAATAAP